MRQLRRFTFPRLKVLYPYPEETIKKLLRKVEEEEEDRESNLEEF